LVTPHYVLIRTNAMPPYPAVYACGVRYIPPSTHHAGGLEEIDAFWEAHGLGRSKELLLFAGYTRKGNPHTIWLQWARSHEACANVWLGLDAARPARVWPQRSDEHYRLHKKPLREFVALLCQRAVPLGVFTEYAFPREEHLDGVIPLPPTVRTRSIAFDVYDDSGQQMMSVTYERHDAEWLTIVMPAGRTSYPEKPDPHSLFDVPYKTACLLAQSLQQGRQFPI